MDEYQIFWGEAHDNTYQFPSTRAGADPPHIVRALERAAAHLIETMRAAGVEVDA